MATPTDPALYERAKKIVYKQYSKPSAYRSGALVKKYKELGGTYKDGPTKEKPLKRWFQEGWRDVNPGKTKTSYPVYRPTKKVSKKTPLTVGEISPADLKKKAQQKQIIKGTKNLKPFEKKGSNPTKGKSY